MSNLIDLEKLFHRSKDRIKELGEVFTPESYVNDMLNHLAQGKKGLWSDEETSFYEPCAGHGNIVLPIFKRRLEGIYKKALSKGIREAAYYSVANALNTLWAIDIDQKNIENCRSRVLSATLKFLRSNLAVKNDYALISGKKIFFVHVLCAIKWHIDENETLSALSNSAQARVNASLTKAGSKWFSQNGHNPMNFDLTWFSFYKTCESSNTVPLEFERSLRFIDKILSGKLRGLEDFEFAKSVIDTNKVQKVSRKSSGNLSVGA